MSQFVLYVAIINLLDLFGVVAAKLWSVNQNPWWLAGTVLGFGGAGFFFAKSLQFEGMAITNILWISISVILITLFGYFFFKENITTLQFIGMGVIVVGLVLVTSSGVVE